MASESTCWPAMASERAEENRAFVRSRLQEKQPEFAAMLELIARELLAEQFMMAGLAPVAAVAGAVDRLGGLDAVIGARAVAADDGRPAQAGLYR
jgi:hypothetical protein